MALTIQQSLAHAKSAAAASAGAVTATTPPTKKSQTSAAAALPPLTVYTYASEANSTFAYNDKSLLPGMKPGQLLSIDRMRGGKFKGGAAYARPYKWIAAFVNRGIEQSPDGYVPYGVPSDPLMPPAAVFLSGVLKGRHIVSGLTYDALELAQVAQVLKQDWSKKTAASAAKPAASFAVVQPLTKEIKSNLAVYADLKLDITQHQPASSASYSQALNSYAKEQKKKDCVLWLQSNDWDHPTDFFYPQKPESFVDIILSVDAVAYPIVVVHERQTWLETLPRKTLEEIQKRFAILAPAMKGTQPRSDARSCFILETRKTN